MKLSGLFSSFLIILIAGHSEAADPLVIAKTGDPADAAGEGLTFADVSPPALTENGNRAAFQAKLIPGNHRSWWFADRGTDGFFDYRPAATTGMAVAGSDKLLDLGLIEGFGSVDSSRTLAQILLDAKTGKLAFVAMLNEAGNLGNSETGETALFIAGDDGVKLIAKAGDTDVLIDVGGDLFPIQIGFSEIKFINDRLAFRSTATNTNLFSRDAAIGIYENGTLDYPLIYTEHNPDPAAFSDSELGNVTPESLGNIAINENGSVVYHVTGRVPNPGIFGNRSVSLLRFKDSPDGEWRGLARMWDESPSVLGERMFISGFSELSSNREDDVVFKALLGRFEGDTSEVYPKGVPNYNTQQSIILHQQLKDDVILFNKIVATGDPAVGYEGEGDKTINGLSSLKMAGPFITYLASYPGDNSNFAGNFGLFRAHTEIPGPGDLLFYIGGPAHVDGLGTVFNILHQNIGPNGDVVALLFTNSGDRRGLVHVSPPNEDGEFAYTLLAASNATSRFNCEDSCPGFRPLLAVLGFIPGGNVLGPALGPEAGYGAWINQSSVGWMLTPDFDRFENGQTVEVDEYSVIFEIGFNTGTGANTDYGDVPETADPSNLSLPFGYPKNDTNPAYHDIDPTVRLGPTVDGESTSQPDPNALGDGADEDGIEIVDSFGQAMLNKGGDPNTVSVPIILAGATHEFWAQVTVPTPVIEVFLNGWIDFNLDGDWTDEGEHVVVDRAFSERAMGAKTKITFPVPQISVGGNTFARFRLSEHAGVGPYGYGGKGEVEDYIVAVWDLPGLIPPTPKENPDPNNPDFLDPTDLPVDIDFISDFGDAPHTGVIPAPIAVPNGYGEALHTIVDRMSIGTEIDYGISEANSDLLLRQYAFDDDFNNPPQYLDDEDGVSFDAEVEEIEKAWQGTTFKVSVPILNLHSEDAMVIRVQARTPPDRHGWINAWIDFNRDGDWEDVGEQIVDAALVPANTPVSSYPLEFTIDPLAEVDAGYSVARVRFSSYSRIRPILALRDGEVEDVLVKLVLPLDFGDAPESGEEFRFPTTLSRNGARHVSNIEGLFLGEKVDLEFDGSESESALGDDEDDEEVSDDEDGVAFFSNFEPGETISLIAFASQDAKLDAWVDFNRDGDWEDDGEKIFDSVTVVEDENLLTVNVPAEVVLGKTYARFRISTEGGLNPFGLAKDGEVEDYLVEIGPTLVKFEEIRRVSDQLYLRWIGLANLEGSGDLANESWTTLEDQRTDYWHTLTGEPMFFRLVEKE